MLGDFSSQAEAYKKSRPDYPADIVDQMIADAGTNAGESVADIGAGTGIFSRLLVDRGLRVTAIEPSVKMQQCAESWPDVHWVEGTFEETKLPTASQRWAVGAQAFHWADPARSLPEIRRILDANGAFSVVWNNRASDGSEELSWVRKAITKHVPEFDHEYRQKDWATTLCSTGDFDAVVHRSIRHVVPMTKRRFVDLWRSLNQLNSVAGPERMNSFIAELNGYLTDVHADQIDVPYVCEAWTARSVSRNHN